MKKKQKYDIMNIVECDIMKKILRNIDKPLLFLTILLFGIGLIMIFSASNVTAYMKNYASPYIYFIRQTVYVLIGFILSFVLICFHSKIYNIFSKLFLIIIALALGGLLLYGSVKNQAISWIDFGLFSVQPSEFAKIITIVYLATFYEKYKNKLDSIVTALFPLLIPGLIAALIFLQPDLGTMLIYSGIVAFIFFIAPISKEIRKKVSFIIISMIIIVVLVFVNNGNELLKSRQLKRFDFTKPCSEEKFYGNGNQVCNGYIAINNGGLTGVGLGNSTQKYLYLPEAHTDFIFAIILEEIGVVGAFLLFTLYFLLLGRILKIGRESYTDRGAMICYGVVFYIVLHLTINLGGILGIMPMTGVPLPFMSYGGSFALCLILALTLVQRVNIENRLYKQRKGN